MANVAPEPQRPLILCIDDTDVALRVRQLVLSSAGFDVLTASSGEAGLELFSKNPVDLVVADYFLTAKTGTETAKEMKAIRPNVPVLIVSASSEEPTGLEHVDEYLSKGEAPEVLLSTIERLLRDKHRSAPLRGQ
jgi:CheY-like chemotaxis protein